MKKLLCIVGAMNAGGAETFLMKIYRQIDKTKYQMDFAVNIESKGFYDDEIISYGGKILRFTAKSESLWRYIAGLKKIVKEGRYDAVLRISSNAMGFMDLAIAKMAGAKKSIARSSNSSDGNTLGVKISHWIGSLLFKRFVDVKIAPSSEAAIYTFGKKDYDCGLVHILHNGLDLDYFSYTEKGRKSVRNEFGISTDQIVFGHVGRFSIQKNHSFLLKFFQCYHKYNPKSFLMLVGDGELKDDIQKKVQEMRLGKNVIFAGIRSDMPAIYSAMDVFLFPSLYEGMPNAVLEAQACGLPCVLSDKITKSADVTGTIRYLPIEDDSILLWNDVIKKIEKRTFDNSCFYANYDVKNVVVNFQQLVWGPNA